MGFVLKEELAVFWVWDAVWWCGTKQSLRRAICTSPWRWKQHISPKRWNPIT